MPGVIDYDYGISAVDSGYQRPRLNAIHLIVEHGRAAVVDCGVNSSVAGVMQALHAKGLRAADVDYVILTHIHLDHAGGAGLLMSKLPNARLTVHPRGTRHLIDPARLIEGTIAVYGEAQTRNIYGDIMPVDAQRIIETPHGSTISLNGRELAFFDTPGHARHHVCVLDAKSGHVFAGDTFGLSYRELDRDGRQFVFPTSSPVQFDAAAAHRSVDLIVGLRPAAVYVTHYSQVRGIERLGDDMHRLLDAFAAMALSAGAADSGRHARLKAGMTELVLGEARHQGWNLTRRAVLDVFAGDIELNAQGLGIWLDAGAAAGA
jgi:glyoxylase-like metal-dependent hydrolase (beta-lactamase superfamily II)